MRCAGCVSFIYNSECHGKVATKVKYRGQFLIERQRKILQLLDTAGVDLHRLLARLTLREDAVGDLLQELFIRLCNSKAFDKAEDPFAYAHRAAMNLAFEWRRKRKTDCQPLQEDCLAAQNVSSALGKMIQAEELQQILNATSKLNDLARDVVVMHYIEQKSYEEIAQRLGKKPQYMRSLCSKAMARLREVLVSEK
ncbi:MAG: sigma-70 family RNA polymerase sigma factor [Phycisphaerae bacterium]|nr:sigma-70 family RNA polymerase sigma factor [Phycisphaerae bacterium]NIS50744.1 sigma-70 family RNA polymerase sigma factor [Phycisphaerae bacterium]NIU08495.1 sigma-70 family RNA polymerase sigma factor [Phycisphaerae bacterium]NIU56024.1 sigma-70 family RNA polymerase sigma factor [Phycisphaerae bacterium]NIW92531.1 sigma-70 family RNA polymerase sigma factor [Phycisphaerae bacterium]